MKENMALQNQAKKWIQVVKIDGLVWNIFTVLCEIFLIFHVKYFSIILDICIYAVLELLVCIFSYLFTGWFILEIYIFEQHTNTNIRTEWNY